MADTEINASHVKARNGYGQNGYQGASSLMPGQTKPPIADVSPPQTAVPGLRVEDTLGARVAMGADGKAAPYARHDGLVARTVDSGSPGGVIGPKTNHSPKR